MIFTKGRSVFLKGPSVVLFAQSVYGGSPWPGTLMLKRETDALVVQKHSVMGFVNIFFKRRYMLILCMLDKYK